MSLDREKLAECIRAMRRLRDNPETLVTYYGGNPPRIPDSLMAIHTQFTDPHEGGYQNNDNANGTLAGLTNTTFCTHMARLGVQLNSTQARDILAHLGSFLTTNSAGETIFRNLPANATAEQREIWETNREAWELFQNLGGHVHYQAYNLRPGFSILDERVQTAIYDPAFHRGNGATLTMMARMLERHTDTNFPGINPERSNGVDADPVVMERIFRRHVNGRGTIVPSALAAAFREHGINLNERDGAVQLVSSSAPHRPIDITSRTPININSVMITTPYDDRLVLEDQGSPGRERWDSMVERVDREMNQLLAAGWTEEQIASAIEAERRVHQEQVCRVQGSTQFAQGWDNRSRDAAERVADIASEARGTAFANLGALEAVSTQTRESITVVDDNGTAGHVYGRNIRVQYRERAGNGAIAIDLPTGVFMYEINDDKDFTNQLAGNTMPSGVTLLEPGDALNPSRVYPTLSWMDNGHRHYMTLTAELNTLIRDIGVDSDGVWGTENVQQWFLMSPNNPSDLRADSDVLRLDDVNRLQQRVSVTDHDTGQEFLPTTVPRPANFTEIQ